MKYLEAMALQEELLEQRRIGKKDLLMLLEHEPTVTLGRGADPANLLLSEAELTRRGIACHQVGRGGDVTYHGPGQLVAYPIVDLTPLGRDLHLYLRRLESVIIDTLAAFGLEGRQVSGKTGVWVGSEKLASIGIGVRHWVSWHGFALNVSDQQCGFATIIPCGLSGVRMTSLESLLGKTVSMNEVEQQVIRSFALIFNSHYAGAYEQTTSPETRLA